MSGSGTAGFGGGGNKEYFVDTKLVFRLKQFVGGQQARGRPVTEDAALDYLLDKFKEYVRKPQVCRTRDIHQYTRTKREKERERELQAK